MTENRPSHALERTDAQTEAVLIDVQAIAGGGVAIDAALLDTVLRAWSPNTLRAFRSDLRLWSASCCGRGVRTGAAASADVTAWIRALAGIDPSELKTRAMATIERYLVNESWAYRMAALPDPTAAPVVRLEAKAARKKLKTRQRQARAIRFKGEIADLDSPAAGVCLVHLLKACRRDALGFRDAALLRIACDTGARRSELVAIEVQHIEGPDADGAGALFIPSSKTDQEGEGAYAYRDDEDNFQPECYRADMMSLFSSKKPEFAIDFGTANVRVVHRSPSEAAVDRRSDAASTWRFMVAAAMDER